MKRERKFAALIGVNFCLIIIIIVTVAGATAEETVEIETDERDEEEELPSLTEILGDGAPLVANTRTTAISGALAYGILGRHCANEGKCIL